MYTVIGVVFLKVEVDQQRVRWCELD